MTVESYCPGAAALETHGCGWWIDANGAALAQAIMDATERSDEQRREMGRRGRAFVARAYAKNRLAERMRAVYEWTVGGGPRPPDVWTESRSAPAATPR